jgi:hypothetical protein
MLPYAEAVLLARKHLAEDAMPTAPGYRYRLLDGRRKSGGWFFDYCSEKIGPPEPGDGCGGAPGFLVGDDGVVTVIGWGKFREMNIEEAKRNSET